MRSWTSRGLGGKARAGGAAAARKTIETRTAAPRARCAGGDGRAGEIDEGVSFMSYLLRARPTARSSPRRGARRLRGIPRDSGRKAWSDEATALAVVRGRGRLPDDRPVPRSPADNNEERFRPPAFRSGNLFLGSGIESAVAHQRGCKGGFACDRAFSYPAPRQPV